MIGQLAVEVASDGGVSRVVRLSSRPPLSAKVLDGVHGPVLMLIGSAAGLLEGDRSSIELDLHPGTSLTVGSVAATLAHPCPGGGWTAAFVSARLGTGARLAWLPEPLVACGGGRHRGRATVALAPGAAAVWYEAVTLGRSGEAPGLVDLRFDSTLAGAPLLRDGLRAGVGSGGGALDDLGASPALLGAARHVGSVFLVGRRPAAAGMAAAGTAAGTAAAGTGELLLAGPGAVVRAVAPTAAGLQPMLAPAVSRFLDLLHRDPIDPAPATTKEELVHG